MRLAALAADSGPVVVLASIAAAGSFTHIHETADQHGQHGWMAWAIAVCVDLTCVMAARERQRDRRTGRAVRGVSWPTVVLIGGVLLSLAANLAQAERTAWGWLTAGTPAGAFLVAVSMLERRSSARRTATAEPSPIPPSFGRPSTSLVPVPDDQDEPGRSTEPTGPAADLLAFAHKVADEHQTRHGRPITRDALRARLGVSNQLASDKYTENTPNALVFTGIKGGPLRRSCFNKLTRWTHAAAMLGMPGLHFHDLRHTGNMLAAATGATTKDLMRRMGHDNERAALIYQHATNNSDQAIARGLDDLLKAHRDDPAGRPWSLT